MSARTLRIRSVSPMSSYRCMTRRYFAMRDNDSHPASPLWFGKCFLSTR